MDTEPSLAENAVTDNGATSGETVDPAILKEKVAEVDVASLKGGGDEKDTPAADAIPAPATEDSVPIEKDDLLERLDKIETSASTEGKPPAQDSDLENDDLIQRLEAMEKDEEAADKKEEAATNHQNGLDKSDEVEAAPAADEKATEEVKPPVEEEKMEVDATDVAEKKEEQPASETPESTANGSAVHEPEEQSTGSVKRRHSEDQDAEPSSKKVHVDETDDAELKTDIEKQTEEVPGTDASESLSKNEETPPEPPAEEEKVKEAEPTPVPEPEKETVDEVKSAEPESGPVDEQKVETSAPTPEKDEEPKPDCVEESKEKMEEAVQESAVEEAASSGTVEEGSKIPESESKESVPEPLPDTEPNTETDSCSQEEEQPSSSIPTAVESKPDATISSSSEEPAAVENPVESAETVTSSDEKPLGEGEESSAEVDSTPVDPTPAAVEEAMEVDSESVAEESSKPEVVEEPCTTKEAFECTNQEKENQESTPKETPAEEPVQEKVDEKQVPEEDQEAMEVDSAAPTQSKQVDADVTESMNTTSEELIESLTKDETDAVADSQSEANSALNKNLESTAADDSKAEESKVLDDSIECSLPTSSSDKLTDKLKQRLDLISNGSSTPTSNTGTVSSSNVYNSTPIQKQFEISSENVSKITRSSVDNSRQEDDEEHSAIVADNSVVEEKEAAVASTSTVSTAEPAGKKEPEVAASETSGITTKDESSLKTESSEVDSCTASSALNTADEINMYASNARKFNGISSTSGSELDDKSIPNPPASSTTTSVSTPTTTIDKLDLTPALTSEETVYEVSVWFEGADLQFLSVEKQQAGISGTVGSTQDLTSIDSSKQSSNGSVGSLGPFSLPPARPTADSAMSQSSTTESSSGASQFKQVLPKVKQTIRGASALATFMIEEFTKIKKLLNKDEEEPATPYKTPKTSRAPSSTTKKSATKGRGQKRPHEDEEESVEEPESKKSAKQVKKSTPSPKVEVIERSEDDQCCLARWTDRKYYAGRVTSYKGDNKYMVVFEDGASKALSRDVIVFGDKDTLPIEGHAIHALSHDDTYEPAIVREIKRNEETSEVLYVVEIADGKTLEVTASDMYLTDEQAKYINKACKETEDAAAMASPGAAGGKPRTPLATPNTPDDASAEKGSRSSRSRRGADKPQTPATPEAGYSGGVGKAKGRRGRSKGAPQQPISTASEGSDVSDIVEEETPAPPSPETGLEFVDGVQPELQRTEKESEIKKMYLVAEYLGKGFNNNHGLDELLGPLPGSKTLFRNKHFILTCTIPPKGFSSTMEKDDLRNRYRKFSSAPFVKEHLRQQIEAGGGKVYQYFEDIPKSKYKQCKLIAPHPCATAKYIQCLAVDIVAVTHEWIIECCQTLTLLDAKRYALPSGWSLIEERYIRWNCGRGVEQRSTTNPFVGCCVNIASLNKDFTEFWSRTCKMAGATVRLIKSDSDLTENLTGYMLTDQEFPEDIKLRASRYGLSIVSTVWVVQSLILGRICLPESHEKLTQIYQDDDY
ncbi:TP53-binding protein 1-like [Uranotaenia lowii]|uniref:TP53-binding protein 1-like n=1 Tax=Uranotaenia lowii TaxID=190385 RepID=UPI00247A9F2D|nr:TP53-binding protein 1-like [Uranotaenia lowii]